MTYGSTMHLTYLIYVPDLPLKSVEEASSSLGKIPALPLGSSREPQKAETSFFTSYTERLGRLVSYVRQCDCLLPIDTESLQSYAIVWFPKHFIFFYTFEKRRANIYPNYKGVTLPLR